MTGHRDLFHVYRDHAADRNAMALLDTLDAFLTDDEREGEAEVERINLTLRGASVLWEERV
jgi:hypothetical protein